MSTEATGETDEYAKTVEWVSIQVQNLYVTLRRKVWVIGSA